MRRQVSLTQEIFDCDVFYPRKLFAEANQASECRTERTYNYKYKARTHYMMASTKKDNESRIRLLTVSSYIAWRVYALSGGAKKDIRSDQDQN